MDEKPSFKLVRQIVRSEKFISMFSEQRKELLSKIVQTGEITQDEVNRLVNEARYEQKRADFLKDRLRTTQPTKPVSPKAIPIQTIPLQTIPLQTIPMVEPQRPQKPKAKRVQGLGPSPKELCSLLISKGLKELSPDEEDSVVNYLEDSGVRVGLRDKTTDICVKLLQLTMVEDGYDPQKVPVRIYANTLIEREKSERESKFQQTSERRRLQEIEDQRNDARKRLEQQAKTLPGCVVADSDILPKTLFTLQVDPELGLMILPDGSLQYSSVISINGDLYEQLFLALENPIVELGAGQGYKTYVRISDAHQGDRNLVYISPLVATSLNIENEGSAFVKLCVSLPQIRRIEFSFLGTSETLTSILERITEKLPDLINAFSYLSLGMILRTSIKTDREDLVLNARVDGLYDESDQAIFAGLIPFGESDIPFEINADMP
jgi:hypothetical protein